MERRLPSLNAIRTFEVAARYASFTKAADELHVTQGAVSRMVQALEEELGVQLFQRIGRTIELTPAGAAYHAQVTDALDRIAAATRSVQRTDRGGMLSISVLPTFALRWLVPRLHSFQQAHPDILVDVTTTERLIDFRTETVDIGIRYGLGKWPHTESTLLMHERIGVFCAPSVIENGKPLREPADLAEHRLLLHTTRPQAWAEYFSAFHLPLADPRDAPGFEHFFMIIEAASAGMGIALLPLFLAHDEVIAGRLVQPFTHTILRKQAYYIAHAPDVGHSRKVRLFKEWLHAEAENIKAYSK
jgi:LysR family transcriptional regulator, glycine cleavage system transcriptional activator